MNEPSATGNDTPAHTPAPGAGGEVSRVVEHLFRHEAGRMVSILTGIFGVEHLGLAEDVVQEALARALQTWPFHGVPDNPAAWIMRASRNLALDTVRRERRLRDKEPQLIRWVEDHLPPTQGSPAFPQEIPDDRLRLMFVCCHPRIPAESQVAIALKTLCGFSVAEIGRALLTTEAAVTKRITRARQQIREAGIPFEIPTGEELSRRLDGVLLTLYLLYNEGYKASTGTGLVREEICQEAIRLATLLAAHPVGDLPRTHALLSLMLLTTARFPARVDGDGNLLRLQEQDRSRWDRSLIARGLYHLARSASGTELSRYHLESGIAACHCSAPDYAATDWRRILDLYDRLLEIDETPVIALNRAIAVANVHGPSLGLEAVAAIPGRTRLESYHLLHAVIAELELRRDRRDTAREHLGTALRLTEHPAERAFLARRLEQLDAPAAGVSPSAQPGTGIGGTTDRADHADAGRVGEGGTPHRGTSP